MNEIIREYGTGLFALADEEGCAEEILTEETEIKKLLSREYLRLLIDPAVKAESRLGMVREAFGGVHKYLLNFMLLMTERGLADCIPACFDEFEKQYYEKYDIVRVKAVSAYPLNEEQKKRLLEKLEKNTGKRVSIAYTVDESLIGGMRLDYGNHLVDSSIKTRLGEIKERLGETVL